MQPWEIFDLDNSSLQRAFVDLKAREPSPLSPRSSELLVLIQREMDERSIAYEVFTALDGGAAVDKGAATQGSDEDGEGDVNEGCDTEVVDGGRAWLQYCPPWYSLPTPPTNTKEGGVGEETARVPDAVKEAGRYKTMWDDSSDSNSDSEVVRPPKPKVKRTSASTGRMTPQGFFVSGPVRRKKKQSVPIQPIPDKRPPVPAFRKKAATPKGTTKPPPTGVSNPIHINRPPPPSRSCQTPPPTFKVLRGLPPSRPRAQSAASPKKKPPTTSPPLPPTQHVELLGDDSISDVEGSSNGDVVTKDDNTLVIDSMGDKAISVVDSPVEDDTHRVVVRGTTSEHTELDGDRISTVKGIVLTEEPVPSGNDLPVGSLQVSTALGGPPMHVESVQLEVAETVLFEDAAAVDEPTEEDNHHPPVMAPVVDDIPLAPPSVQDPRTTSYTPPHSDTDSPLRIVDSPIHQLDVISVVTAHAVPTIESHTTTPIVHSAHVCDDEGIALTSNNPATMAEVIVPQDQTVPPPNSYGNYFNRFEDILIEPFHLRPYSELPQNVVVAALQRFITELEACKVECADIDVDNAFNQYICKVQKSRSEVYELITDCLLSSTDDTNTGREWIEADGAAWNVWWSWKRPLPQDSIWLITQSVNHIPKAAAIARKDLLKRHVQRYAKGRGPGAVSFKNLAPLTFTLPTEYVSFTQCFAEMRGVWIMKTVGMSRGRGITITDSIEHVTYSDPVVIQRYVDRPLLLAPSGNPSSPRTHKFDLRLYVVVTQFSPLECFISHLGLARIAGRKYDPSNLGDLQAHLTNTAVSNELRSANTGSVLPLDQTKWTLWALERYVEDALGAGTWGKIWPRVCETVLKSLACAEDAIPAHPCCFELFGFDVLLDEDLSAWLLEVNASPAMDIDCQQDEDTKPRLIREIVRLLDPLPTNRDALLKVVRRRVDEATKKRRRKPTSQEEAIQRDEDLGAIFEGRFPRRYGEMPACMGEFERLAPSPQYNKITALKKVCV